MEFKVGFHARNFSELERVVQVPGVNLVEVKPDGFNRAGEPLYSYADGGFEADFVAMNRVTTIAKGKQINVHLPFEEAVDSSIETGLCYALPEHHEALLSRFAMFGNMHLTFGIGEVLTMHPPVFMLDGAEICDLDAAILNCREFLVKLDAMIKDKDYKFQVGVENVVNPKTAGSSNAGFRTKHLDTLIGRTSRIGITIDTGHRLLTDEMSIAKLVSYGNIVNCHFHANPGVPIDDSYKDDAHLFAVPEDVGDERYIALPHFWRHMSGLRRRHTPIVLEVKLDKYSDQELATYVSNLRGWLGEPGY
jgi:hypothetical protein